MIFLKASRGINQLTIRHSMASDLIFLWLMIWSFACPCHLSKILCSLRSDNCPDLRNWVEFPWPKWPQPLFPLNHFPDFQVTIPLQTLWIESHFFHIADNGIGLVIVWFGKDVGVVLVRLLLLLTQFFIDLAVYRNLIFVPSTEWNVSKCTKFQIMLIKENRAWACTGADKEHT